jgi:hypothetical protein
VPSTLQVHRPRSTVTTTADGRVVVDWGGPSVRVATGGPADPDVVLVEVPAPRRGHASTLSMLDQRSTNPASSCPWWRQSGDLDARDAGARSPQGHRGQPMIVVRRDDTAGERPRVDREAVLGLDDVTAQAR